MTENKNLLLEKKKRLEEMTHVHVEVEKNIKIVVEESKNRLNRRYP